MKLLKRFNREQLTLAAAAILGVLLLGWQFTRSGSGGSASEMPTVERIYGRGSQSPIEFASPNVQLYLAGRDIWDPPAAGRLPIPEIDPPEPKLGQMTLPPLSPRPDDNAFNMVSLPGKIRTISSAIATAVPAGFPPEAEIQALKSLAEAESPRVVDRRRQLMRPDGLSVIHLLPPKAPLTGRIQADSHETSDQTILIEIKVGETGITRMAVKPDEINKSGPGDEGVERGGEYGKEYLRRANRIKPDNPDAHHKLGVWARETAGMLPEARVQLLAAVEEWKKRNDLGSKMKASVLYLVDILRDLGNYDEAIMALQDFIDALKPNDTADLHLRLGSLYAALGYHERSLISYDAAFSLEPGRVPPQVAIARARLNLGEVRPALEHISALLVGRDSVDPEVRIVQGVALLRQGQADAAEAAFADALRGKPNDAEALNGLGVALALQKKPEAAGRFLAAIKADQYLVDAWINLALLYLSEGRPVEAEILFNGAAQRDPDSAIAAAGPGFIALLKGAYAEAAPAFERARKIAPDDFFLSYALGRLRLRGGQAREALELFRAALKSNPDYLPATTDAALAYLMLASEEQQQAAGVPADKQAAFRERADALRGNAQTLLEAAFVADPSSQSANAALGCVYAVRGRVREAEVAFNSAVKPGVPDPLIDYGRGYVAYWFGGGAAKARLELAEIKFTFGASHADLKDPYDIEWSKKCAKAVQAIQDWRTQRILIEETFEGSAPSLANQWVSINIGPNPQVRFANNQANFGDDSAASPSGSFTALEHRDIPREDFLRMEWTWTCEATQGFDFGFSLYTSVVSAAGAANGLHFVFLEDRAAPAPKPIRVYFGMQTAVVLKGPNLPSQLLGALPAAPGKYRFKLERIPHEKEQNTWVINLYVWEDPKGASKGGWKPLTTGATQIKAQSAQFSSPMMFIQFWGRTAAQGKKWSVGVDDIRVITVEK